MAQAGADVVGIDLVRTGAGRRKTASARIKVGGDLPQDRRRGAGRRAPVGLRSGDLHGAARACARSRRRWSRLARGWLRPGGIVVCSTINRNPKSYLFAIIGAEYVLKLLPRGTHDYARFLKPAEIAAFARRAGLELVDLTGMTYNPLARTYRLEPDTVGQLHRRRSAAMPEAAGARTAPRRGAKASAAPAGGCRAVRSRRNAGRYRRRSRRALNRVRADRGLPRVAARDVLRPQASHGARGLFGGGLRHRQGTRRFRAAARRLPRVLRRGVMRTHDAVSRRRPACSAEIERRGLRWGIVTNKAARFTLPVIERLALAARAGAVICGDTTRETKPHPAPLLAGAAALAIAAGAMRLRRRRRARHHRRASRRHAYAVRRVRLRRRR